MIRIARHKGHALYRVGISWYAMSPAPAHLHRHLGTSLAAARRAVDAGVVRS